MHNSFVIPSPRFQYRVQAMNRSVVSPYSKFAASLSKQLCFCHVLIEKRRETSVCISEMLRRCSRGYVRVHVLPLRVGGVLLVRPEREN